MYFELFATGSERGAPSSTELLRENALFSGDIWTAFDAATAQQRGYWIHRVGRNQTKRVNAAMSERAILLACEMLEGSVVSLSRWVLQAAASPVGATARGPSLQLLRLCAPGLEPSVEELIERTHRRGVVLRSEMTRALTQCAAYHRLWRHLATSLNASVDASTSHGWRPLHYAAALGSPILVRELLELGADPTVRTNLTHATPLHVAAAHGANDAAELLSAALPPAGASAADMLAADQPVDAGAGAGTSWWRRMLGTNEEERGAEPSCGSREWADAFGRSAEDLAAASLAAPAPANCEAMLAAIRAPTRSAKARARAALRCTAAFADRQSSGLTSHLGMHNAFQSDDASWRRLACNRTHEAEPVWASRGGAGSAPTSEDKWEASLGRCDLPVVDWRNSTQLTQALRAFTLGAPFMLRGAASLSERWRLADWSVDGVRARLGRVWVPLEPFPYAARASAQPPRPDDSITATIDELLAPSGPHSVFACPRDPTELPLSVFLGVRDTHNPPDRPMDGWSDAATRAIRALPGYAQAMVDRVAGVTRVETDGSRKRGARLDEAAGASTLRAEWDKPAFLAEAPALNATLGAESIQFYLGGTGSGTQPHWHTASWNAVLRGRKRWLLWPPERASYAQLHVAISVDAARAAGGEPLVCEQREGDVLIVPPLWGHATINLVPSLGFATELSTVDRAFDLGF